MKENNGKNTTGPNERKAGGKPSTWSPPGRLVERSHVNNKAKRLTETTLNNPREHAPNNETQAQKEATQTNATNTRAKNEKATNTQMRS